MQSRIIAKLLEIEKREKLRVALTGPTVQPSDGMKPLSFILSSASDLKKLQHTRVNIFDLKILQVFFINRGEILVFLKKC